MATEKRLIDANELLERLEYNTTDTWAKNLQAVRNWWPHAVGIKDNIVRMIKNEPTVDAVEVVRCKDCKHLMFSDCYGECGQGYMGIVKPYDFCSYGERKDK